MTITPAQLARMVDHTLLKPEATAEDIDALVAEAIELGVYSVCVSPSRLPVRVPEGSGLLVATVAGFPSGAHHSEIKAFEAANAVHEGANEVDMVINLGAAKTGQWGRVSEGIEVVRKAIDDAAGERYGSSGTPIVLKAIIESAALTDDEIVRACLAAEEAGADFVKTSTGYHPAGGASVRAVEIMAATVGESLGVKASGGIRTWDAAVALVTAGATRLGLSGTRAVLAGATAAEGY